MKIFEKGLSGLVTVSIPILISGIAIMFLLSPFFLSLEYRRPNFPVDSYGFSTEERLDFGNQTRRYLISKASLDDLRVLKFDSGDPIYIERELSHLEDVKLVLQGMLRFFYGATAVFLLGGSYARVRDWNAEFLRAITRGGRLTAGILAVMLFFTLVSFQSLFTNFHLLFFEGDSWLFYYSDSLIRLFPVRFWQDIFLVFGLITLAGGAVLGWYLPARSKSMLIKEDV